MDMFLDGKTETDFNNVDTDAAQKLLQDLLKSNPDLLIQLAKSVQSANI